MTKFSLEEFKKGINPYGIPYSEMTKGKSVVVDIPINHEGDCLEVEGVITKDLWYDHPCRCAVSQIKMTKQRNRLDAYKFSKMLYAVYPEKIKKIL